MAQKCRAIKADGEQCRAWAVSAGDGDLCAGHAGLGMASDPAAYAKQGQAEAARIRRERAQERRMSLLERIAAETERRAEEIVAAYFAAGARGDWRALEALVTRVHGRPVERVAVEADPDPFGVAAMSQAERGQLVARVLQAYPHLAGVVSGTELVQSDAQTRMDTGNSRIH